MPWVADALAARLAGDVVVASGRVTRSGFSVAQHVHINLLPNVLRHAHARLPYLSRLRHPSEVWDPTIGRWLSRRASTVRPDVMHLWGAYALEAFRSSHDALRVLENGSFHPRHDLELLGEMAPSALRRSPWIARLEQEYELADAILVPTQAIRRSLTDRGVPEDRVRVVPYGVTPLFRQSTDHERDIPMLFVGNLNFQKGIDLLLRCVADGLVAASELLVIGRRFPKQGYYLDQLLRHGVKCIEHVDQPTLATLYARSRWILIPSRQDGTPLVCLEAMSAGCVPIISSGAGLASTVAEIDRRLVIPAGEAAALGAKVRELAQLPTDAWRELSQAVRTRAASLSWPEYAGKCISIYEELLDQRFGRHGRR
jgi:glycosyltransferase involved in cell wall biosynthesis